MKIFLASDHAGFALKESLRPFLASLGHEVVDCGALALDDADDYPDFVLPCAQKVKDTPGSFGIIFGASGQGEAMMANRIPGVRAGVYYGTANSSQKDMEGNELDMIESLRTHNDANILSLGARFLTEDEARRAVVKFLDTKFLGGERHVRRIEKLDA
jgi:ribose 5-phosphate isomerase B